MGYGFYTQEGFLGQLPSGAWMLFPTQEEYIEFLIDESETSEKSNLLHLADAQ